MGRLSVDGGPAGGLMKRPNVRAAIEAGIAARDNPLTRPAVLLEISRVAFANMADYVQLKDGQPSLDLSRITHARAAGFRDASLHAVSSTTYGVLGQELPIVFVLAAKR